MTVRLRAEVKRVTGATTHYWATITDAGEVVKTAPMPAPSYVEIEQQDVEGSGSCSCTTPPTVSA
jgi:hypothetical protein